MVDPIPYFDGHNDVLTRLAMTKDQDVVEMFLKGNTETHIDLPRARKGGMIGGLYAMFCPPVESSGAKAAPDMPAELPPMLDPADAWASVRAELAVLQRILAASDGEVVQCTSVAQIRDAIAKDKYAIVLHLEGAEAIEADFDMLEVLYGLGLRSLGPVWSRSTIFAHGVPFRFPADPDIGEGLTDLGKELVRRCNDKKILIDLSHMNAKGFWDVAKLSASPLVATHSNVHAICPTPRNLTADQLAAIKDSQGFVGLNFATGFLREDGKMNAKTDLEWMVRHLDALIAALGEDLVGLGSDFDGAVMPEAIGTVAGTQALFEALRAHGYDEALLKKIGSENWLAALERVWG